MSWIKRPSNAVDCPECKGHGCFLVREGSEIYRDGSYRPSEWRDCDTCWGEGWVYPWQEVGNVTD